MKKTSSDNRRSVTLMAVGDVMLGDHSICIGHGVGSKIKKRGAKYVFQHVREILNEADITFGNLEAALSKKDLNEKDVSYVSLRAMPESVDGLTYAGFSVLSLANNHIMEHGKEALLDTMNILRASGIKYVGPEDVVLSIRGTKVIFLAYCLLDEPGTCCKAEPSEITENVRRLKTQADIVIVSLHWGDEFIHKPSRYQVKLAHEIIDSGASIILGHHPHVLQGIEKYNGGLIAYSLGNFVFDMWQEKMRETIILKCHIADSDIMWELIPVYINDDFQPQVLQGGEATKLLLKLDLFSQSLSSKLSSDREYVKEVAQHRGRYQRDVRIYFLRKFYKYNPRFAMQHISSSIAKKFNKRRGES